MSDNPPCAQPCGLSCSSVDSAGLCPGRLPLRLDDVLARFWRESERGVCDTGRYRLPYFSWGKGPPLLFIHGLADSRWSFLLPIARLAEHFRCIAYDLPNGYDDGARLRSYQHETLVDDVWALLDHLGIERSYVLGASFGATIALRALRRRPDRLPRAVLQGGMAYRPLRRAERWLAWLARFLPGPTARIPKREKILDLIHRERFARQPPEVWRAFVTWTGAARLAAMGHQARWLHGLDLRDELPDIRQPVLLICGDHDTVVPAGHTEMLQNGLPSAGVVVLEGCGHLPAYTHPEAFAEVVRQFLTPPGPAPSLRHPLTCQEASARGE
jgi:pimeloyl-ACP methyl ester carboxylesterase